MKASVRYNPIYKEFEAACTGYFGGDFFRLDQIVRRQTEIYNLMKVESPNVNLLILEELYTATEAIRVLKTTFGHKVDLFFVKSK